MTDLSARNALRPGHVDHLAVGVQMIEFALPIVADHQDVHAVAADVRDLLPQVLFHDDLVRETGLLDAPDALRQRLMHRQFSTPEIVILARHAHDQVVSVRPRALQNIQMSVMEHVKCSVSDDFFHRFSEKCSSPRASEIRPYRPLYFKAKKGKLSIFFRHFLMVSRITYKGDLSFDLKEFPWRCIIHWTWRHKYDA